MEKAIGGLYRAPSVRVCKEVPVWNRFQRVRYVPRLISTSLILRDVPLFNDPPIPSSKTQLAPWVVPPSYAAPSIQPMSH